MKSFSLNRRAAEIPANFKLPVLRYQVSSDEGDSLRYRRAVELRLASDGVLAVVK